jgi:hypothetical protein
MVSMTQNAALAPVGARVALRKCIDLCGPASSRFDSAVYQGATSVVPPGLRSVNGLLAPAIGPSG